MSLRLDQNLMLRNAPEKIVRKIVKSKLLMQNSCETPCQMLISLTV